MDNGICTFYNCPYRKNRLTNNQIEIPLFYKISIAGMPNQNEPKNAFFDLIRKVHKGSKNVKEVIITDPYIYSDSGESGKVGGYNNLIEYLKILGLTRDDTFTLMLNPNQKIQKTGSKNNLENTVKNEFPYINYTQFSHKYIFHDRLYLVRDGNGQIKGVFGPSLNGLTTNSIILFGEIDDTFVIKKLQNIFD